MVEKRATRTGVTRTAIMRNCLVPWEAFDGRMAVALSPWDIRVLCRTWELSWR